MALSTSPTPPARLRLTSASHSVQTVPIRFLSRAAALPGKTLAVALALCSLSSSARSPTVVLGRWALSRFSVSADAAFDALTRLSDAGMIRASRSRGRHARITLLDEKGAALSIEQ